jgi:hypothetical protein
MGTQKELATKKAPFLIFLSVLKVSVEWLPM